MKLEWIRQPDFNPADDVIRFSGEITLREVERLNLDAFDRKLLDECGSSKTADDLLLALEILFRRQREQGQVDVNVRWRVVGDHPVLARPDKRNLLKHEAEGYAASLRGFGYENVQVILEQPCAVGNKALVMVHKDYQMDGLPHNAKVSGA